MIPLFWLPVIVTLLCALGAGASWQFGTGKYVGGRHQLKRRLDAEEMAEVEEWLAQIVESKSATRARWSAIE
jgi:hypothetical protein